jgi:hypothetical protein
MVIDLRHRPTEATAAHWDGSESTLRDVLAVAEQPTNWSEYADGMLYLLPANGTMVVLHRGEWLIRHEDGRLVAVARDKLERQFEPTEKLAVAG